MTQSWGGAHIAGVAHNVRDSITGSFAETAWNGTAAGSIGSSVDTWGYGVIGGVTFNLPMLSAGSKIAFQGAYAEGAIGYSGAGSPAWGESDDGFNPNGNGLLFPTADGIFNPLTGAFEKSKAWSAAAQLTWKVSPNFEIDPEVSYASVEYDSAAAALWTVSPKATAWWIGAVFDWSPVKNLDFALDAIYETSHQTTPEGWDASRRRQVPERRRRLQRPPARRPLLLSERSKPWRSSAPERKLRGLFCRRDGLGAALFPPPPSLNSRTSTHPQQASEIDAKRVRQKDACRLSS